MEIGVISDTHGWLRPEALHALRGMAMIIHAGDVGSPEILPFLQQLAPLFAVRGNVDHGSWAQAFPKTQVVKAEGCLVYVLHDLNALDLDPAAAGFQVVVSGHTHQPQLQQKNGVLYLNPGSAGPQRFHYPATVARLSITNGVVEGQIIEVAR